MINSLLQHKNDDYKILNALKALHPGPRTLHVALLDCNFPLSAFLLAEGIDVQIRDDEPRHELVVWNALAGGGSAAGLPPLSRPGPAQGGTVTVADEKIEKGELYANLRIGANIRTQTFWSTRDKSSTQSAGHAFVTAVYRWYQALKDEIWVFQGGGWAKEKALCAAIRNASWDDLILEKDFLDGLRRDTRTFFDNREIYQELGVVWKRGLLLLGPPGNGKTESIKVLLKESGQTALYGPEAGVRLIFDHARSNAPCILVIEDLDSLVSANVRSFFLNELDGLAQNEGILTIATTNHPEQIDDAILNRPSRFDVKYDFALPTPELRSTYSLKWIRKILSMGTSPSSYAKKTIVKFESFDVTLAVEVAEKTEGWSFAFLKELFVSFLLGVAYDRTRALAQGTTQPSESSYSDSILLDQVNVLSTQILTVNSDGGNENAGGSSETAPVRSTFASRRQHLSTRTLPHSGRNF